MKVISTNDPERELRKFRSTNPRITGIALTLYANNEIFTERIIASALGTLERTGTRRDGRWVGTTAEKLAAALFEAAAIGNMRLLDEAGRLKLGQSLLDREAGRR
jgi:hypothetical protein